MRRLANRTLLTVTVLACVGASVTACGGSPPSAGVPAASSSPPEFGTNVARIPGLSPSDVAASAVLATYPPDGHAHPQGWVLLTSDDWKQALLAAQFAARPANGGLLITNQAFLPLASQDVLGRVSVGSFPRSGGVQTLLFGKFGADVLRYLINLKLRAAPLLAADSATLDLKLVPFRGGFAHGFSGNIVVVSSQARDYALPAGAWSAYSGDTIAFVSRDAVPAATRTLLAQRQKLLAAKPSIYIVGPPSVISSTVQSQLGAYGTVKRIAGPTAIDTAVAFARYRDPSTGFGWGLRHGPASVTLLDTSTPGDAVAAFDLAAAGPQAPLLLTTGSGPLPASVRKYLKQLGSGGRSQGYILGNQLSISSATLREVDGLLG
jgi:hypothetical protein